MSIRTLHLAIALAAGIALWALLVAFACILSKFNIAVGSMIELLSHSLS